MNRLTKPAADLLREEIEAGNVIYSLETHILLYGSCRTFEPKPASKPTRARPGSQEKIEVMRLRVMMGEATVHPRDNTVPVDPSNRLQPYVSGLREIDLGKVCFE